MQDNQTLRLVFPQWQGGGPIADFVPELPAEDAYKGYFLGAQLLSYLAPEAKGKTIHIPVSLDIADRAEKKGIISYDAIVRNTKATFHAIEEQNPQRIVTLGGECSVSVVPFTWLANKYHHDVAVIWIDAHPDLNFPDEGHHGYHAMALAAILGKTDEDILRILPASIDSSRALIAGLRAWEKEGGTPQRQRDVGVRSVAPADIATDSTAVLHWLQQSGVSKALVHLDLDAIDPDDMIAAVGVEPNGLTISRVTRLINDIHKAFDIVGLTIAEPMPRVAIKIRNMLAALPLL